ncbi:helix-turn-helix transcriptional regulator [Anaerosacchariphilus polymeriproducens]|uniref:YafY family transcriptional regulator n=1 Tax=Anaerosacchariphilus polymeriproducens TaxID=1812858 RepID=A0A371AVS7_9FIRM|nr:YafY family protein [Anaerosacchariphilus polymeriproducens]RDU23677.1 YafY family transcriptional regulator [Anaerosacchariphilus polymeriproducens]
MKFERMIAIVMLLLQRKRISGKELTEMFEVSLRTIYRDIESIAASGIPITTTPGAGGGIEIMEQYKVDKGIFTADDISAMLTGLGIIRNTLSSKDITNALVKLESFVSEEQMNVINMKLNQIMFDLSSWMTSDGSGPILDLLKSVVENKCMIAFSYFGSRGKECFSGIEPHRLVLKGNHWYLQAYLPRSQVFRLFKLRRMSDVQIECNTFTSRNLPHPYSDFTDRMSSRMFPIKLLIDSSVLDKMLDYCTMEEINDIGNDKYTVNFNFIDDDYGYGILMSFGNKLVCLEPDYIRMELKKRLEAMLSQYNEKMEA